MKYIIAIALSVAVLGGCSRSGDDEVAAREEQDAKIARLEKEVSRLRSEVRELRRRMDTAPKAASQQGLREMRLPRPGDGRRGGVNEGELIPGQAQAELKQLDARERRLKEKGPMSKDQRRRLHDERHRLHQQRRAEREVKRQLEAQQQPETDQQQ